MAVTVEPSTEGPWKDFNEEFEMNRTGMLRRKNEKSYYKNGYLMKPRCNAAKYFNSKDFSRTGYYINVNGKIRRFRVSQMLYKVWKIEAEIDEAWLMQARDLVDEYNKKYFPAVTKRKRRTHQNIKKQEDDKKVRYCKRCKCKLPPGNWLYCERCKEEIKQENNYCGSPDVNAKINMGFYQTAYANTIGAGLKGMF